MSDKKANKQKYKTEQLEKFRQSLPIAEDEFIPLFDYLDIELSENDCKNNFALLEKYCKIKNINPEPLERWFCEHGGYCDCEILANVEEQFYYLEKPVIPEIKPKKQTVEKQKLNGLITDFGFSIEKVPNPWILTAVKSNGNITYNFQIGKKSDFPLYLKVGFPVENLADDKFVHNYWLEKTELDYETNFIVDRQTLTGFNLVQIKTEMWLPVIVFIYNPENPKWCLIMKTETPRLRNDLKVIEKLLKEIKL